MGLARKLSWEFSWRGLKSRIAESLLSYGITAFDIGTIFMDRFLVSLLYVILTYSHVFSLEVHFSQFEYVSWCGA